MGAAHINWINYKFIGVDGYGLFGRYFVQSLHRIGVHVSPFVVEQLTWPSWMRLLAGLDGNRLSIALMPSYELRPTGGRIWNFTMYEGTGLEERWGHVANRVAERMIVPHEWLIDVMRDNGIHIPVHVVPGGTCPTVFPVTPSSPYEGDRPYTFLALGDRGSRKGHDVVWRAFWKAFEDEKDVRLIVKARLGGLPMMSMAFFDPRVTFWREDVEDMNQVYALADCFVFPSTGEGWGMPPREFAMTGKPVIATRGTSLQDGIDEWAIPLEKVTREPADLLGEGTWDKVDADEVAERMRWCYDHRAEARQKGLAAAAWLRDHQTWDIAAHKLMDLIEEYR